MVGEGTGESPSATSIVEDRRRPTIGDSFSRRSNSLNFIRLVLATSVIVAHSFVLGGFRSVLQPRAAPGTLGYVAVYAFFGISGYLIAASAVRNSWGRYLWQRILRIFPAFWVCLVVTAFGFQIIGWFHSNPAMARTCGVSCYIDQSNGPFGYIFHNFFLRIDQPTTSNTLHGAPFPGIWNGSLWSLYYEFICYLVLGALAVFGLLRHRATLLFLALTVWVALIVLTVVPGLNGQFNLYNHYPWMNFVTLLPIFLAGAVVQRFQHVIPDSAWLALICTVLFGVTFIVPLGAGAPGFSLTSIGIAAPLIAYPLVWLGIHLPCQRIGSRNDYSYGVYIYAFPVQQVLALSGAYQWGLPAYMVLSVLGTVPFAVGSWWLIEKHALRLKKAHVPWTTILAPLRPGRLWWDRPYVQVATAQAQFFDEAHQAVARLG
jgi:peptidoglycan/LPS O-acetylase OafA/YrhL